MTANLYAAERSKTPLFKHSDKKWHVDFVENGKWIEKAFIDHEEAYKFYLNTFHKLEQEFSTRGDKVR